jgi:hypothetical protein
LATSYLPGAIDPNGAPVEIAYDGVVTIASVQLSRALGGTLSPWKGGGFGMFASIDSLKLIWNDLVKLAC